MYNYTNHLTTQQPIFILAVVFLIGCGQSNSKSTTFLESTNDAYKLLAETAQLPSNSFRNDYLKSNPNLKYNYDSATQIHNYSHNWDFDKDGVKDELYFVGTNGAHLYYFLK
jgi:hypothetical protein